MDISTESTVVSNDITGVNVSTCPYISTKGTGVNGCMSTGVSMVNTLVQGRTNAYEKYWRYNPNGS